jgi:hypothetical protein
MPRSRRTAPTRQHRAQDLAEKGLTFDNSEIDDMVFAAMRRSGQKTPGKEIANHSSQPFASLYPSMTASLPVKLAPATREKSKPPKEIPNNLSNRHFHHFRTSTSRTQSHPVAPSQSHSKQTKSATGSSTVFPILNSFRPIQTYSNPVMLFFKCAPVRGK